MKSARIGITVLVVAAVPKIPHAPSWAEYAMLSDIGGRSLPRLNVFLPLKIARR